MPRNLPIVLGGAFLLLVVAIQARLVARTEDAAA